MNRTKSYILTISLLILLGASTPAYNQCSMCRAVAESGAKDEKTRVARGLNNGILYLLAMPYIIGAIGFIYWRKNRRKQVQEQ